MGRIFLIVFKVQIIRDVIDKALIVALITGGLLRLHGPVSNTFTSLYSRARLDIFEVLSDGQLPMLVTRHDHRC